MSNGKEKTLAWIAAGLGALAVIFLIVGATKTGGPVDRFHAQSAWDTGAGWLWLGGAVAASAVMVLVVWLAVAAIGSRLDEVHHELRKAGAGPKLAR